MLVGERRKGFTLIELLVVIAVIAILAAILFPVFARAKARARQTTCLANVRQWATACLRYTDDYNGRYPYAGCNLPTAHLQDPPPVGQGKSSPVIYMALEKYTAHAKQIRFCPEHEAIWRRLGAAYSPASLGWSYWYDCAHNNPNNQARGEKTWLCGYDPETGYPKAYSTSDVTAPEKKPLIREWTSNHRAADKNDNVYTFTYSFCDGHARLLALTDEKRAAISGTWRNGYVPR